MMFTPCWAPVSLVGCRWDRERRDSCDGAGARSDGFYPMIDSCMVD